MAMEPSILESVREVVEKEGTLKPAVIFTDPNYYTEDDVIPVKDSMYGSILEMSSRIGNKYDSLCNIYNSKAKDGTLDEATANAGQAFANLMLPELYDSAILNIKNPFLLSFYSAYNSLLTRIMNLYAIWDKDDKSDQRNFISLYVDSNKMDKLSAAINKLIDQYIHIDPVNRVVFEQMYLAQYIVMVVSETISTIYNEVYLHVFTKLNTVCADNDFISKMFEEINNEFQTFSGNCMYEASILCTNIMMNSNGILKYIDIQRS